MRAMLSDLAAHERRIYSQHGVPFGYKALMHHVHRGTDGGLRGAFGGSGLE